MDKAQIVAKANEVSELLVDGRFEPVRALVDANELVYAVWQDEEEPDGVGTMIVKGQRKLQEIITSRRAQRLKWTAISCTCAEQAEALKQVAGEPDPLH
jgi:hypothetical protein